MEAGARAAARARASRRGHGQRARWRWRSSDERPDLVRDGASTSSADALAVARANARAARPRRSRSARPTCSTGAGGPFDAVLANVPYVATESGAELAPEIRQREPRVALVAGRGRAATRPATRRPARRHAVRGARGGARAGGSGGGAAAASRLRGHRDPARPGGASSAWSSRDTRERRADAATFARCIAVRGVAVFPADTVYGLACEPDSKRGRRPPVPAEGTPARQAGGRDVLRRSSSRWPRCPSCGGHARRARAPAAGRRDRAGAQPRRGASRWPCGDDPQRSGCACPALEGELGTARRRRLARAPVQRESRRRPRPAPARRRLPSRSAPASTWSSTAAICRGRPRPWSTCAAMPKRANGASCARAPCPPVRSRTCSAERARLWSDLWPRIRPRLPCWSGPVSAGRSAPPSTPALCC